MSKNNGQLRFRPPPRVAHASRLDQYIFLTFSIQVTECTRTIKRKLSIFFPVFLNIFGIAVVGFVNQQTMK